MSLNDRLLRTALKNRYAVHLVKVTRLDAQWILLSANVCFAMVVIGAALHHGSLAKYLHRVDAAAIYQLAISVGAALLGLVGVVFTLTLFVIQQVSSTSIPGLLREYANDTRTQLIYVALTCVVLVALGSALIIPADYPFAPVFLVFLSILSTFFLLWLLFARVVSMADPINVIEHIRTQTLRELEYLELFRMAIIEQSPDLAKARVKITEHANPIPNALASLRHFHPNLTAKTDRGLRRLHTLSRQYASQHNEDLFGTAMRAATDVLGAYIDYHGQNITMGNTGTFLTNMPLGQDRLLSNSLEAYRAVAEITSEHKDREMSKVALSGLSELAVKSVDRPPLPRAHGENATTAFIAGTMSEVVQGFITKRHVEGVFASFDLFVPIALYAYKAGYYSTGDYIVRLISNLTQLILMANERITAAEGVSSLVMLLLKGLEIDSGTATVERECMKELFTICRLEAQSSEQDKYPNAFDYDTAHPISRLLHVGDRSLVGVHQRAVEKTLFALKNRNSHEYARLTGVLKTMHDDLPFRLAELGTLAAGRNRFIFFWLEGAAFEIAKQMLTLWYRLGEHSVESEGEQPMNNDETRELLNRARYFRIDVAEKLRLFIIYFYSRSRRYHAKGVFADGVIDAYESAVSLASDALAAGATDVSVGVISMLGGAAQAILKEQGYRAVHPVTRFVGHLLETAAIARVKDNPLAERGCMEAVKGTFQMSVVLTATEQEKDQSVTLDDPGRLLLSHLREYIEERILFGGTKSRTFLQIVPREVALSLEEDVTANFGVWAGEV